MNKRGFVFLKYLPIKGSTHAILFKKIEAEYLKDCSYF